MRIVRFKDREVRDGDKCWTISGTIRPEVVHLDLANLHGDINDMPGLRRAVSEMLKTTRYARALNGCG
jgi:hypothetical protein